MGTAWVTPSTKRGHGQSIGLRRALEASVGTAGHTKRRKGAWAQHRVTPSAERRQITENESGHGIGLQIGKRARVKQKTAPGS